MFSNLYGCQLSFEQEGFRARRQVESAAGPSDGQANCSCGEILEWTFLLLLSRPYDRLRSPRKRSHLSGKEKRKKENPWSRRLMEKHTPLSLFNQTCSSTGDGSENAAGTFVFDIYTLCTLAYLSITSMWNHSFRFIIIIIHIFFERKEKKKTDQTLNVSVLPVSIVGDRLLLPSTSTRWILPTSAFLLFFSCRLNVSITSSRRRCFMDSSTSSSNLLAASVLLSTNNCGYCYSQVNWYRIDVSHVTVPTFLFDYIWT